MGTANIIQFPQTQIHIPIFTTSTNANPQSLRQNFQVQTQTQMQTISGLNDLFIQRNVGILPKISSLALYTKCSMKPLTKTCKI